MATVVRNRYRVIERLGQGGGGSVYAVTDLGRGGGEARPLALKALFVAHAQDASLLDLLRQEFRVLAMLRHPRLAQVFDFGKLPADCGLEGSKGRGGYFFTRELIEGQDLLAACYDAPLSTICQLALESARLLDVLHGRGMIHGDFKPANVIVDGQGEAHLIDFGLVRGEGSSLLSGTAAYLAPELIEGRQADRRADLYAFGIALYQLVVGQLPLPRADVAELLHWHLHGDPLRPSKVPQRRCTEALPEAFDALVERLTARDPEERYPSAGELSGALERVIGELGVTSRPWVRGFVAPSAGRRLAAPLRALEERADVRLAPSRGAGDPERGTLPAAVVLRGAPGSGKRALLRELAWRRQLGGVEALRVSAQGGDGRVYGPLHDLLDQVAGLVGHAHPLMGAALSHDTGSAVEAGLLESEADRFAVHQRVVDYLHRACRAGPLLLSLDSLELADVEVRMALRFIAHTLDPRLPLLLVLAHDPDPGLDEVFAELPRVCIPELDIEEVSRLYAAAAGHSDDDQAAAIHAHTGGNARFVLEVLEALAEASWPPHPELAALAPPTSLEERCSARWGCCTEVDREVLAALAVVGRPLSGASLSRLLSARQRSSVGLPLETLEASGWLRRGEDGAWGLSDGGAAASVLRLIDAPTRRRLHRSVFESLGADSSASERARHGLAAGLLELAWADLEAAVQELRGLGTFRPAMALLDAALEELGEDDPRRPGVLLRLGELASAAGDYPRATALLEGLLESAEEPVCSAARLSLARAQRLGGAPQTALETLTSLRQGGARRHLDALVAAAAAQAALDDHGGVEATVKQGLALITRRAPKGEDPEGAELGASGAQEAELWARRAWACGYSERHEEAAEAFATALGKAREVGARRVEADVLNSWSVVSWRSGDYAGLEERYGKAAAILDELGEVERATVARFNLGGFQLQRGVLAPALEHLEGSLRRFEGMGMEQHAATARCNLGQLQLELGLYEQAQQTLERARREMDDNGRSSGVALASLLLGLVAGQRREFDTAREEADQARRLFREVKQLRDAADASLDLAEMELEAGRPEAAEQAIRAAEGELELEELGDLYVRALTLRARVLARAGTRADRQARRLLDQAFERAEAFEAPRLHWGCHAASMELMLASGERQQAIEAARAGVAILDEMAGSLPPDVLTAFWGEPRRRAARQLARARSEVKAPAAASSVVEGPTLLAATLPPEPGARLTEERFYRLLEIYRQINSELDPERLLGVVMDTAVELTGAERGFLLLGPRPDALRVEISRNIDPEAIAGAYSRSIAERVFASGEPVITVSAHNDPRFADVASVHQLRLESVLCIPVHARGRVAGVLYMESRFTTGRFTPADQRLLMAFGDQVAIALENARLLADNTAKTHQLERAKSKIEVLAEERGRLLTERTAQLAEARRDLAETRRHLEARTGRFGLVGASQPMERLFELIARVAQTPVPVLIEGESGTGKEMVARAIHSQSPRTKRRLVSVNCAAIPENLLESELFGHVRGAFTGADREKKGLFAVADGGSLFLDEIGDMPMRMQVDMLRALQEHTIRPVGGSRDLQVDVRVIAASNKSLSDLVRQGDFREDLFYRLHVVKLDLPPLRERADDIPLLVDHFLGRITSQMGGDKRRITRGALKQLMEYRWPGNVRQLEHSLVNAAVLAEGSVLDVEDFTLASPRDAAPLPNGQPAPPESVADREVQDKQRILAALEAHSWNKSKAAEALGIPRRTFYRRLKSYGIV